MTVLYAATHPERVTHLVLCSSFARYVGDAEEGGVAVADVFDPAVDWIVEQWGQGGFVQLIAPSMRSPGELALGGRVERYSASPQTVRALWKAVGDIDVRPLLVTITVPTLVLRRSHEIMPAFASRYIADHIPGAKYMELPGVDHLPWVGDRESYVAAIEEFVTGQRSSAPPDDRVLATVLFSDIVGSTERAAALGDERWCALLDRFRRAVRAEVEHHRGREVNTRGDDFLVLFDGPARAVRCAAAIRDAARQLDLTVRSGLHAGEVELREDDVAGLAVHIGARAAALAEPGEILTTTTVRDLVVGASIDFVDRGEHELRGVPGRWRLLAAAP